MSAQCAPEEDEVRKLLPLLSTNPHGGGRSALTCRYRCGDACFHEVPNTSDNEYVGDVIAGALSRHSAFRAFLRNEESAFEVRTQPPD